ncbi:hypothetical protein ACFLU1_04220 [Chloroflexota bacterium]
MDTLDQLRKQLNEWTIKKVESHNELMKIMHPITNLTANEPLTPWMPTRETLDEYDRLYKAEVEAFEKCREIMSKMFRLRDEGKGL